jgi:hypothetical protein
LLNFAAVESDSFALIKEQFSLNHLINNIVNDYKQRLNFDNSFKNIELALESPSEPYFVNADKEKLTQVLNNLLNNAIKFTQKGRIVISLTKHSSNQVKLSIQDAGVGIDKALTPKLFTKHITGNNRGFGLGLYISKKIIKKHKGKIGFMNNETVNGSTFFFILPTVRKSQVTAKMRSLYRCLILDEDYEYSYQLAKYLEDKKCMVDIYKDPQDLLKEFSSNSHHMLVIDTGLSGVPYYELANKIKDLDDSLRICFLSRGKINNNPIKKIYPFASKDCYIFKDDEYSITGNQIMELLMTKK